MILHLLGKKEGEIRKYIFMYLFKQKGKQEQKPRD